MKKLIVIILILLIIFIGMYVNRKIEIDNNTVSVAEVEEIETYMQKIYMWREITEDALPVFDNINNANDVWIWEVVKKNLEEYELSYEKIQEKAKEIFGENFTKAFPKEGTEYLVYDEQKNVYNAIGMGLDQEDDCFFLNRIEKNKEQYNVEIIEYLVDYSEFGIEIESTEEKDIKIKNLREETIATIKSTEDENKIIDLVKENADKFTKKEIVLNKNSENKIYISSVSENT